MNKKGIVDQAFNWAIFRVLYMIIIAVVLLLIITSHFTTGLNSRNVENIILIKRMIYSPNFLAYHDKIIGRVYPGTIDLNKFTTDNLESNIIDPDKNLAVNIQLTNLKTGKLSKAYINEERARIWDDYVVIGGYDRSTFKRYVRIFYEGEFYPGVLNIKVISKQ